LNCKTELEALFKAHLLLQQTNNLYSIIEKSRTRGSFSFLCIRVETPTHNPAINAAEYSVSGYRLFNRILETARF